MRVLKPKPWVLALSRVGRRLYYWHTLHASMLHMLSYMRRREQILACEESNPAPDLERIDLVTDYV